MGEKGEDWASEMLRSNFAPTSGLRVNYTVNGENKPHINLSWDQIYIKNKTDFNNILLILFINNILLILLSQLCFLNTYCGLQKRHHVKSKIQDPIEILEWSMFEILLPKMNGEITGKERTWHVAKYGFTYSGFVLCI